MREHQSDWGPSAPEWQKPVSEPAAQKRHQYPGPQIRGSPGQTPSIDHTSPKKSCGWMSSRFAGQARAAASDDISPPGPPKSESRGRPDMPEDLYHRIGRSPGASSRDPREPHAAMYIASGSSNSREAQEPSARRYGKTIAEVAHREPC